MTEKQYLSIYGLLENADCILSENNELDEDLVGKVWELNRAAMDLLNECETDQFKIEGYISLKDVFDVLSERMDFRPDIEPDINCRCMPYKTRER